MVELTEQEVKGSLAIAQYPNKWRSSIDHAKRKNNAREYWTNARDHFLALGGLFKHQLHNNGNRA